MINHIADRRLRRVRGRARAACEKMAPAIPAAVQAYLRGESITPDGAQMDNAGDRPENERRNSARVSMASEVLVRRIGGFAFQAGLRDVSTRGCRIELIEPCEVGDPVITRFPQLEPLGSRVCWSEGVVAGVEFATTIHPAVFDSLLARLADAQTPTA
jgi:hypothetical protein